MATINGYTLIEPPLKGGMAIVYKGQKGAFTRAFKMLRPDKADNNPQLCERFLREVKVQTHLDHPNIIKMLDAYPYTDTHGRTSTVIEMEWLNGMDLQRYITERSPKGLDKNTVVKIARQVIDGLEYAHGKNILHLDIKPSNLFRTIDGYIKIIDFGIARVVGENAEIVQGAETVTIITELGDSTFKGTIAYSSPEQQVGAKLGYTSDIFSFGKTLLFLLTGTTDPSVEISDPLLDRIINKCIAQNPKHRYQSFMEVRKAFDNKEDQIKCQFCGTPVNKTSKFCPECGRPLYQPDNSKAIVRCPKCNKQRIGNNRFCDNCGYDYSTLSSPMGYNAKTKKEAIAGVMDQVKHNATKNEHHDHTTSQPKVLKGYKCSQCLQTTKAYSDGKVNFCNYCGAPKSCLTPIYQ